MGHDSFKSPGGDILRKMLGVHSPKPKEVPTAKKPDPLGGGGGRKKSAAAAPEPEELEPLYDESANSAPNEEKAKVILRNPRWEAEDVGFNEETEISVETELPPELANKTAVLFELSANAPNGPERISQADGFAENGKAKAMIPVFQPQYREADGSIPTKVEYQFTAKHSHSELLKDDKAIRIVDHMAERVIDTHILQDITIALDKSFVRAREETDIQDLFQRIKAWQEEHPDAKMAVFGHTDALGDEPYNKTLSEKRAKSIHALMVKYAKIWLSLYDEEKWGIASTQEYLKHLGHDPGVIDGQDGPKTQAAVKEFQASKGLGETGKADAGTREALYLAFMESCGAFKVEDKKFDAIDGSPFMGCSEFNLVKQTQGACEANRRVAVFLLKSGRICETLARDADFLSDPDRKMFLLPALAAVRPVTGPAEAIFRAANDEGYFNFNGPLLVANGSPRALSLFEEMVADTSVTAEDRVDMLHKSVLANRTRSPVFAACRRLLERGLEPAVVAGLIETLFDYQEKRWFGVARFAPVPPPWTGAETGLLQAYLDMAQGLRGPGRFSDELQDAIDGTVQEIRDILAVRAR